MARHTRNFSSIRIRIYRKRRAMTATRTAPEEEKGNDNKKNGEGGANTGKKRRGGIDESVLKEKEVNDYNNIKCKYMYILLFSRIIDTNDVLELN